MGKNQGNKRPRGGDMDWTQSPEWARYRLHIIEDLVPKIRDSAVTMSLCPRDNEPDVKYAVELGMCIMLDKPIIVLSDHEDIPEKLRKVADVVVIADMDTAAGRRKVQEALTSFMNEHKGNGEDDSTDDDH